MKHEKIEEFQTQVNRWFEMMHFLMASHEELVTAKKVLFDRFGTKGSVAEDVVIIGENLTSMISNVCAYLEKSKPLQKGIHDEFDGS